MSFKSGAFGPAAVFQNPLEQREYDRLTQDYTPSKAAAQPYAHFSLEWLTSPQTGSQWFGTMQLFVDVNNLLNLKFMYFERPFFRIIGDPFLDYNAYMTSLHLPRNAFKNLAENEIPYLFIPGNDRPGDFRKEGVAFVPIHIVRNQRLLPPSPTDDRTELYYIHDSATYLQFVDGNWQSANPNLVAQVLKDQAYIDMPDKNNQTFLNPRSINLGVRFSF